MQKGKKILIVEDDLISAEYLKEILKREGYEIVDILTKGKEAIEKCKDSDIDLILMDIMLEDNVSGCEAAVEIKNINPKIKIIFLTAYAEEEMIEYAYEAEAYGYLTKPYREKEILATVRLAFSHEKEYKKDFSHILDDKVFLKNGYVYSFKENKLFKNDQEVPLSKKGLKLIEILAKNKNRSVSKEQLFTYIWGENRDVSTLRSLIHRIRKSLGEDLIENINNIGYRLNIKQE